MEYPQFFDDYEDKQAVAALAPLLGRGAAWVGSRVGSPLLQRFGGWLGTKAAPAAAQAAGGAAGRTWGQWGWNTAKQVGGMAGTMIAADQLVQGLGYGGQAQGATDTASMEMLQAAYNHPDPQYRLAAQQYLAQTFGMNPAGFQQPQQPQNVGDMTLNSLTQRFGGGMTPSPQSSSPFYQPQAAAQPQVRTVYVPLMPQGYQQPQAPQMAARPDAGQPPAPAPAPQVAARPAAGQPPAPAPVPAPQMAARPATGQPPAPAPRPQPSGVASKGQPPANSLVTPPPKPVPAAFANMPTATAASPVPWFLRNKEAAAGGSSFFRKEG